jgi:hypothetical protein
MAFFVRKTACPEKAAAPVRNKTINYFLPSDKAERPGHSVKIL